MLFRILMLLILFLSGCSNYFNEPPLPKKKYIEMPAQASSENAGCQIDLDKTHKEFFAGDLTSKKVQTTVDCLTEILDSVSKKVITKKKGTLTLKEINAVLQTRVLGKPQDFSIWVDRLFSIRHIILGVDSDEIQFLDFKEILNRVKQSGQSIQQLSSLYATYETKARQEQVFWDLRKKMFTHYMDIIRKLLGDDGAKITHLLKKNVLLNQYNLWETLEDEIGSHYISAGYFANHVLLGNNANVITAPQLLSMIEHLEFIYARVCEINAHLERTIWIPEQSIAFMYSYELLLEHLFDMFLNTELDEIKKDDLVQLLELIHAHVDGKASKFVEAILDFKSQVFGGNNQSFARAELKGLMKLFHESVAAHARSTKIFTGGKQQLTQDELRLWLRARKDDMPKKDFKAHFHAFENFNKQLHFWTSPFEKKEYVHKQNFLLTQVTLPLADRVIESYDADGDKKLSLQLFNPNSSEIGFIELASLVATMQKSVKGLDLLMGEKAVQDDLLDLNTFTLGKAIVLLSDQLLLNSNADGALDRYEIIEAVSFVLENARTATWFFEDESIKSFHTTIGENEEKGLLREGLVDVLKDVPTLQWYFPQALKTMSEQDLKTYIALIISVVGRADPKTISIKELETVFSIVRLIELIFLRYDEDNSGILDEAEVRNLYQHVSPTIEEFIETYESRGDDLENKAFIGPVFKHLLGVFKGFYLPLFSRGRTHRKVFEYSLSRGQLPKSVTNVLFFQKAVSTDRIRLVKLFASIYKELGN